MKELQKHNIRIQEILCKLHVRRYFSLSREKDELLKLVSYQLIQFQGVFY